MPRWATVAICLFSAALFGWAVPLARVFEALTPYIGALSIMAAGLLVRLNRTMPTLEWKTMEADARQNLTTQIVGLSKEYVVVLALVATLLLLALSLIIVGPTTALGEQPPGGGALVGGWPDAAQVAVSAAMGLLTALVIVRMGYVVWRDYDIVKLQAAVILAAAGKAEREQQIAKAESTRATAAQANLRAVPPPPPQNWSD